MTSKTFELKFPFEHNSVTYSSFEMRRPKVRDLEKFSKELENDPIGAMEMVLADLVEQDETVITEMDLRDFNPLKREFEARLKEMSVDKNQMTSDTITLKYPFEFGKATYTTFTMRRPKVKDLKKFNRELESDPMGALRKAIADLVDAPDNVIQDLDLMDYGPMKVRFEGFLNDMANEASAS